MPTIAVASLNDKVYRDANPRVTDISFRNKLDYCMAHEYSLHLVTHSLASRRKGSWSKLPLLKTLLELHDWVFWADTDCLFMNHNIRLEDLIDGDFSLIITTDMNGLSSGNFLIKRGQWATEFLKKAWTKTECMGHWGQEQLAMEVTLKENPRMGKQVKYVQQNLLCSYHGVKLPRPLRPYEPGDFLVHFPARCGSPTLLKMMREFSGQAIKKRRRRRPARAKA